MEVNRLKTFPSVRLHRHDGAYQSYRGPLTVVHVNEWVERLLHPLVFVHTLSDMSSLLVHNKVGLKL